MNTRLINAIRRRLSVIASAGLIVLAAALAASALMAQPQAKPKTDPQIPNCLGDWPPANDPQKGWLKEAFDIALHDSAMPGNSNDPGPKLRQALLDTKNNTNFDSPKKAIKKILDKNHPGNGIKFPDNLVITFYEEEPQASPTPSVEARLTTPWYHPNHCYLVLYLDPVGSMAAKTDSRPHVMCCYDPY